MAKKIDMSDIPLVRLDTKVVLITGGYGHLGQGIVKSMLLHGATVYVLGRNENKFKEAFKDFFKSPINFIHCDVSITQNLHDAVDFVKSQEGRVDTFINNATYSKGKSPTDMLDADFALGMEGVLQVGHKIIKKLIPIYKDQGFGKIINVASMYGVVAPDFGIYDESPDFLNPPHYGASKAGLIQLTKYYASYLGHLNIQVNAVSPGAFPSKNVQKDVGFVDRLANKTALKRIGKPSDLGGIFVFLGSDASNYITGQNFMVDGGWTTV